MITHPEERGFIGSTTRKITIPKQYLHVVVEKAAFAPLSDFAANTDESSILHIGDLGASFLVMHKASALD